ncbi:protein of unknown function [Nitrospira japonica]|uniref:Uncharacterized protein n=1 Tax=Nitrospira japonica TaxID=1325564 RepID=A0A1W1I3C4_9BACT|nr:protein of unknown function [Nitrospira japonica]
MMDSFPCNAAPSPFRDGAAQVQVTIRNDCKLLGWLQVQQGLLGMTRVRSLGLAMCLLNS